MRNLMNERCAVKDCHGLILESNVHKPAATCNMNPAGTPTGCNSPELHHAFVPKIETAFGSYSEVSGL